MRRNFMDGVWGLAWLTLFKRAVLARAHEEFADPTNSPSGSNYVAEGGKNSSQEAFDIAASNDDNNDDDDDSGGDDDDDDDKDSGDDRVDGNGDDDSDDESGDDENGDDKDGDDDDKEEDGEDVSEEDEKADVGDDGDDDDNETGGNSDTDDDVDYGDGNDEAREIGDHSIQDIRDLILDAIHNKDGGEMDADNPLQNLPYGPDKLKELYLRSGGSHFKGQLLNMTLGLGFCILFLLL